MDIFNNPLIKKIALGKLKSYMTDNGISAVIVTINPATSEIEFDAKEFPIAVVPASELEALKKLLTDKIKNDEN